MWSSYTAFEADQAKGVAKERRRSERRAKFITFYAQLFATDGQETTEVSGTESTGSCARAPASNFDTTPYLSWLRMLPADKAAYLEIKGLPPLQTCHDVNCVLIHTVDGGVACSSVGFSVTSCCL